MNFVFISPGFPKTYYHFCESLQEQGVNVLAIGDVPYDELSEEVKHSVKEYYYVDTLEDYDALVKAIMNTGWKVMRACVQISISQLAYRMTLLKMSNTNQE